MVMMKQGSKIVIWAWAVGLFMVSSLQGRLCNGACTKGVRDGLEQFTNNLLQNLESTSDSNFVVSPYSIHSVFTGLLVGSHGQTRRELEQMLGVNGGFNTVNGYGQITRGLGAGDSKVRVANMMALARGFKPKLNYSRTLGDAFEYDIRELNFSNREDSAREINDYVASKTAGKIKELISPEELEPLTRMILINAVYFKGVWKYQFDQEQTFSTQFSSPKAGSVDTQFMTLETDLRMMKDPDSQLDILELPYGDDNKSMIFVLPQPGTPTTNLTTRLSSIDLARLRTLPALKTNVTIPRFTMKYQTPLKEKIVALGSPTVFSTAADLSEISSEPLYASDAVHQAFIEVNEVGTEAAAATAVQVGLRTARRVREFFADRPFLFLVHDLDQDVTLFAGKVVDPSSSVLITRSASIQVPQAGNSQASEGVPEGNKNQRPCAKYLRDFPNALDNYRICRTVAEEGQFLDWLRENRKLCEESQDLFNNFKSNDCDNVWCDKVANIRSDMWSNYIKERCGPTQVVADKQLCKNTENKVTAKDYLKC